MSNKEVLLSLLEKQDLLRRQLEAITIAIDLFKKEAEQDAEIERYQNPGEEQYSRDWNTKAKSVYFIRKENRFLHAREITDLIAKNDGTLANNDLAYKVSQALNSLKSDGTVTNIKVDNQNINTFWGSPDWYDEAVGIIGGRDYDLGQLKNSKMRI